MAKVIKNIYRAINAHKIRFLTISLVIASGIALFIGFMTAFVTLDGTYLGAMKDHSMASFTMQSANPTGTGSDAWIDYDNLTNFMNEFKSQEPLVERFELRIVYDTVFTIRGNRQNGRIVAFSLFDKDGNFRSQPSVNGYTLLSGSEFKLMDNYRNVCYVEGHIAEYWKLEENDFIAIGDNDVSFQVVGSIASPEYLLNMGSYTDILPSPKRFGVAFLPLSAAQRLLSVEGKVNEISVKLKDGLSATQREKIADRLKNFLEDEHNLKMSDPVDFEKQVSYYLLKMDIEEAREMGVVLPIIILGMAMGGLYILLGRMVVAERKDIGVSQALGYSRRSIILQYVGISLVVSIVGTVIGIIAGIIFASRFGPAYLNMLTILFPMRFKSDVSFVIISFALGIATGLIGGYFPVKSAIQDLPAESLRFDPSLHITSGKIPLFERLLNKMHIHLRTTGLKLPIRNFFRSKKRTFSSTIGVIISVSLISMSFGMIDSMNQSLLLQYNVVEDWDLRVDFGDIPTNGTEIVEAINDIDDVEACSMQLISGTTLTSTKSILAKTVQLIGLKEFHGYMGHHFIFEEGNFNDTGVVLSVPIAQKLNIWINDNVTLEIAKLTKLVSTSPLRAHFELTNISLRVTGIVEEFNGLVAYVGLDYLKEISNFPGNPASSVFIKVKDPTNTKLEELKNYIFDNLGYNVRNVYTNSEQVGDLLNLIDSMYLILDAVAFFSVLLAAAMVYNTVYINLQEQQREIATLLTIGTPRRKIIFNVTTENSIITLIGSVIGLAFGWLLMYFMFFVVLDMEFFRIKILISLGTALLSFGLTFIAVLIAESFPLRKTLNLNLAEATKERVV